MSEIVAYNVCDAAVFCALHGQLASLGKHAQLTRFFSAVAELLVLPRLGHGVYNMLRTGVHVHSC